MEYAGDEWRLTEAESGVYFFFCSPSEDNRSTHQGIALRLATSLSPGHDQDVNLLCSMPVFHTNQVGLETQAQLPARIIPLPPLKISRTSPELASTVTAEGGQPG